MLTCEGFKMFQGRAVVKYRNGTQHELEGTWLYRPDTDMWYVNDCPEFPWGTCFYDDDVEVDDPDE